MNSWFGCARLRWLATVRHRANCIDIWLCSYVLAMKRLRRPRVRPPSVVSGVLARKRSVLGQQRSTLPPVPYVPPCRSALAPQGSAFVQRRAWRTNLWAGGLKRQIRGRGTPVHEGFCQGHRSIAQRVHGTWQSPNACQCAPVSKAPPGAPLWPAGGPRTVSRVYRLAGTDIHAYPAKKFGTAWNGGHGHACAARVCRVSGAGNPPIYIKHMLTTTVVLRYCDVTRCMTTTLASLSRRVVTAPSM